MSCLGIDLHTDCFTIARRLDGDVSKKKCVKKYFIKETHSKNLNAH